MSSRIISYFISGPTLEFENGTTIWESSAIMRYLCKSTPNGTELYPLDLQAASKVDMVSSVVLFVIYMY